MESPSILFAGMAGSKVPIVVSNGEGRVVFEQDAQRGAAKPVMRFVTTAGEPAERYPGNPNGSVDGLTGFTSDDGRATILMPHPERVFRYAQMSWAPKSSEGFSPWMRIFQNARQWLG